MTYDVVTMATRMGIRELRDSLTSVLRRVRAGESIEITHHGIVVAVINPAPEDRMAQLIASGEVTPAKRRPTEWPKGWPSTTGLTTEEILEDDRGDR